MAESTPTGSRNEEADQRMTMEMRWKIRNGASVTEVEAFLLSNNLPVDGTDHELFTHLHSAVYYRNIAMARMLLSRGADPNARTNRDFTPLHLAARGGFLEICDLLIQSGADVNARTSQNFTPLHQAANVGRMDVMGFLQVNGAEENAETLSGWTAEELLRLREAGRFPAGTD